MKFTDLFVRRPVLALVISTLILMLGVIAILQLPIRQYPMLESSTITVTTNYPGASAELMQGFVTQPIAQAVSSVEGIDYLTSSSVQGSSTVTVRMELNRDSTQALTEVMAKVNQVRYKLPEGAFDPVIERAAGDSSAVAYVGFASESVSAPALTDYLARVVQPMFATIDGVAKVDVYGGQQLAMRLWIDPAKLAARSLTAADVADAVRRNNYQAAPGKVKGQFVVSNISVNTDLTSVAEFRDMVITKGGDAKDSASLVRLKDVGTVELGAAATETSGIMDGVPAVYLGLSPTPGGNPLVIVDGIKKLLPEIQKTLPPGVKVELAFETARFIQSSIDEVARTLLEALLIVVIVIYLCMGSLRSVLIPVVTIPLSMLGAAALMLAFGFSINLLTLLAMVLAVGLVVDDAIVVVENVHRHIEEGKTPVAAALVGAREVAGPVIAMTITLAAVYAPIGMMGGLTGALFKEFALTLAGAVVVSGVVALTLSPVMSSLLLQPKQSEGRMARAAEHFFEGLTTRYARLLDRSLHHRWLSAGFAALVMVSLPFLYLLPQRELAPAEDQASVLTAIKAPQHANLDYVERFSYKLDTIYKNIPETASRWIINGGEGPASSIGGINLTPWAERSRNAAVIQAELQHAVGDVEGTSIFAFQLAPLPGSSGGLPVQLVLRSAQDYATLFRTMEDVKQRAHKRPVRRRRQRPRLQQPGGQSARGPLQGQQPGHPHAGHRRIAGRAGGRELFEPLRHGWPRLRRHRAKPARTAAHGASPDAAIRARRRWQPAAPVRRGLGDGTDRTEHADAVQPAKCGHLPGRTGAGRDAGRRCRLPRWRGQNAATGFQLRLAIGCAPVRHGRQCAAAGLPGSRRRDLPGAGGPV